MTIKYVLKTQNTDNTISDTEIASSAVTETKIAANAVTGAKLAAAIDLPSDAQLGGTALSTLITAAAGGYDFHEAVKTAVLLGSTDKGTGWNYASHALTIQDAAYTLGTAGDYNCNVALSAGDRIAVVVSSGPTPVADEANGIYVLGTLSGGVWSTTRATDANSVTNLTVGALTFLTSAVSPLAAGQGLMLAGGGYESASAVWSVVGAAGASYTAGNGINIDGSSVISVVSNSGATTPVTVGSSGLSVRSASASQTGAMSSVQYSVVDTLASFGKRYAGQTTSNTGSVDVNIPFTSGGGALAINSTALVDAVVVSRSTTDATKRCVTRVSFALSRGGSGNSSLVGDVVTVFKEHDTNGIGAMTVDVAIGTNGVDAVHIVGADTHDITHDISITTRVV